MEPNLKKALSDAAVYVFDTAAFLSVYASENETLANVQRTGATIAFRGPHSGEISLFVEPQMLDMLAMNMLGEPDDEDPEERSLDALKEVLNMICGNLLTMAYGENAVFDLSPPQIVPEGAPTDDGNEDGLVRVILNLEETLAELKIREHRADTASGAEPCP